MLITVAVLLCSTTAHAYDFEVDGIYYNIVSLEDLTVEVTRGDNEYRGEIIIPPTVTYKSKVLTVTSIDEYTFQYCSSLTTITIPESVTEIGERAFYCSGITKITIPDNVTSIEGAAFYGCSNLTCIIIGAGITYFENNAFTGCRSLKELYIQDSEGTIGFGCNTSRYNDFGNPYCLAAFYDCPLESVYLDRDIYSKYPYTFPPFENNTSIKFVVIGNNVTTIGEDAFYGCSGLTEITIPDNVTSIEEFAFKGCSGLTNIRPSNNITSIAYATFEGCESLTSIIIPENVTSIESWAFSGCSDLEKIYLMCATPPTVAEENYTNAHFLNTTVYVPQGSLETYQAADTWKDFWDIQEFDATGIEGVNANDIAIEVTANGITLSDADSKTVAIYSANGTRVANIDSYVGEEITLDRGVYIVRVGSKTMKVKL